MPCQQRHYFRVLSFLVIFFQVAVIGSRAEIKPSGMISDGMVLQQKSNVKIWGTSDPNEKVTVTFRDQTVSTTASAEGAWLLRLQSKDAGGPFPMTLTGSNTIQLPNVYVGEVWLLSGQSNMELALNYCTGGPEAVANSANPLLRLMTIPHVAAATPQTEVKTKWVESGPATTRNFSAVGYWFGSKLQKQLGVPVGLINDVLGGTDIEAWLSRDVLDHLADKNQYTDYDAAVALYDGQFAKQQPLRDKYDQQVAQAAEEHQPKPLPPHLLGPLRGPSMLYNGMIAPIENYTIKGVIWYQGESNSYVGRANTYGVLLPKLIELWRAKWGLGDFPFIYPQITPYRHAEPDPNTPSGVAVVREGEVNALKEPNTAMVVTMDLADPDGNVHYHRKEPVGERLKVATMGLVYGGKVEYIGPFYQAVSFEGDKAILSFTHTDGGLVARDGPLTGFTIAGPDKRFVAADAVIQGDKVVVSSPAVSQPASVRYGWADNPVPPVNLWNKSDLAASPFRTDDWALPIDPAEVKVTGAPGATVPIQNNPAAATADTPP